MTLFSVSIESVSLSTDVGPPSGVTRGGSDRPRWHHTGGDSRLKIKFLWPNLERILDKRCGKMGVVRRRQLKRSSLSRGRWLKKSVFFPRKNRVTPSVAAPGDTNLLGPPTGGHSSVISCCFSYERVAIKCIEEWARIFDGGLAVYNTWVLTCSGANQYKLRL